MLKIPRVDLPKKKKEEEEKEEEIREPMAKL